MDQYDTILKQLYLLVKPLQWGRGKTGERIAARCLLYGGMAFICLLLQQMRGLAPDEGLPGDFSQTLVG